MTRTSTRVGTWRDRIPMETGAPSGGKLGIGPTKLKVNIYTHPDSGQKCLRDTLEGITPLPK
jgi:hypothetical protein